MRKFAAVLILTGIVVMLYPLVDRLAGSYKEQQLLDQWQSIKENESGSASDQEADISDNLRTSYAQLNQVFSTAADQGKQKQSANHGDLLGLIKIKKIDLRLPILEGATQENLDIAAGHITGTAPLGASGNAALAAHRSYTYGKQFNRLNELEIGDKIVIETRDRAYEYTIFQKKLVLPSDLSVLSAEPDKTIVTLITCHPMKNPTHRLIVQASLQ